jgi:hypothetical protein
MAAKAKTKTAATPAAPAGRAKPRDETIMAKTKGKAGTPAKTKAAAPAAKAKTAAKPATPGKTR